jgi:hypothetical protein
MIQSISDVCSIQFKMSCLVMRCITPYSHTCTKVDKGHTINTNQEKESNVIIIQTDLNQKLILAIIFRWTSLLSI